MPLKKTTTVRSEIAEMHKFEDLRRYYERKHYDETGEARRFSHADVMRSLLNEPEIRTKWEEGGRHRRAL